MRNIIIGSILLISIIGILAPCLAEEENPHDGWQIWGQWYEWKVSTDLPQEQREIVDYFENAGEIGGKIEAIQRTGPGTMDPKPSPDKAIDLINGYIEEYRSLKVPKECKKHYEAKLKAAELAIKYQEIKKKYGGWNEELGKVTLESMPYESTQFSEFWRVINEVGLQDNMEEEWIYLGFADREEMEKEYSFFKEYKKDSPITCPECGEPMRRVKIVYEDDDNYEDAHKIGLKEYLFSNERFNGCPEHGYVCDDCNKWYEEYPGKSDDLLIVRNWCWGWHELVYKKKAKKLTKE